jgi:hypothetical protein
MIEDTLRKLEERIRASERTGDGTRTELLELVAELRTEFDAVARTSHADAAAIAEHAGQAAAGGPVADSMLEFESAHPRVVGLFQALMRTLADAGI